MARIVGVDLPKNKRGEIGLTYIYGIGRSTARKILDNAGISYDVKVNDWSDDQVGAIRWISAAIAVSAIVWVFPFAVRAPRTMPVPARAARRP